MGYVAPIYKNRTFLKFFFPVAVAVVLLGLDVAAAAEQRQVSGSLFDSYQRIKAKLADNSFGFPLYLESSERDGRLHVDVYGIFNHSFDSVLDVLNVPANWCDIASLHPNVKACTYSEMPSRWQLTFYTGRKFYQSPGDTRPFTYHYRVVEQLQNYLALELTADEGPFGTTDHRMNLEALPLRGGRTFVHVSYAYSHSFALSVAAKAYFATLGRDKVGFTVNGTDNDGEPIYIRGPRGAIERNVVRYYLAIQSFMDTMGYPDVSRFHMRISEWYDLTNRYRKQLFELEKKDYLFIKTKERKNQEMLQREITVNLPQTSESQYRTILPTQP